MNNLCIIPARGGSKRIPRKNIKDFLGLPIITYSIKVALESGVFEEVMVSTDDLEIAEIAKKHGAKVPFFRSKINANDYASTNDVIIEVVSQYELTKKKKFDNVCCIYPTAPLIQSIHIKKGLNSLLKNNYKCVLPVVEFSYPIWRGFEITSENEIRTLWPEYENSRTQDLKKVYHDSGQWYWFDLMNFSNFKWPKDTGYIILKEEETQDIDNLSDWNLAELKYKNLNKKS